MTKKKNKKAQFFSVVGEIGLLILSYSFNFTVKFNFVIMYVFSLWVATIEINISWLMWKNGSGIKIIMGDWFYSQVYYVSMLLVVT